jgi:hypothetical protein
VGRPGVRTRRARRLVRFSGDVVAGIALCPGRRASLFLDRGSYLVPFPRCWLMWPSGTSMVVARPLRPPSPPSGNGVPLPAGERRALDPAYRREGHRRARGVLRADPGISATSYRPRIPWGMPGLGRSRTSSWPVWGPSSGRRPSHVLVRHRRCPVPGRRAATAVCIGAPDVDRRESTCSRLRHPTPVTAAVDPMTPGHRVPSPPRSQRSGRTPRAPM